MAPNAPQPTTASIVGGTYHLTPDTLQDGQVDSLQLDSSGNLKVSVVVGGGSNVNITGINGVTPALTNPLPVELSDGVSAVGTPSNPLNVSVRKIGYPVSTVQLGNAGVYRGPGTLGVGANAGWVDSTLTGGHFVSATAYSDQPPSSFRIYQSDDYTNTNLQRQAALLPTNGFGQFGVEAVIKSRYWRIVYINSATPTTSFEIACTESTEVLYQTIAGATSNGDTVCVQAGAASANQNGSATCVLSVTELSGPAITPDQPQGTAALNSLTNTIGQAAYPPVLIYGATTGGTLPGMFAFRIPTKFNTAAATNFGNSAVWTPAAGKKFRLMRYQLELTANATLAVAALITVKFQDSTTDFGFQFDQWLPVTAAPGATVVGEAWRSGWIDMGNGYLSTVANNVLNFNISGAANLTAGQFRINVCGTEE